jgi:hypothetical protein
MLSASRIGTDLKRQMQEELRAGQRAARAAIQQVGEEVQGTLRNQARAGFPLAGERMARTWRLQVFPRPGVATLRPTALISSRAPTIADGFDKGAVIRAKSGKFLAVPTGYNRAGGRRGGKPRFTPKQMVAARKQAFVLPIKGSQNKLWCLRVTEAQSRGRSGRITRQAIAGNAFRVGTGRNTVAGLRPARGQAKLLEQGFVPMFILIKQVQLKKVFDIAGTARRASERIISVMRASYSAQR